MEQKQVLNKLNQKVELKRAEYLKLAKKDRDRREFFTERAAKLNCRNISGLQYRVKSNRFTNSSGSCEFFPDRLYAHSYTWYDLLKVIKGRVILNDYRYSNQTSKHIGDVRTILKDLKIKYECLEAPRGLQELEAARSHEIFCIATAIVAEKYARKKAGRWVRQSIQSCEKRLELLSNLGFKTTKKMRAEALERAEASRKAKNERLREKSALKKKLLAVEIVSDFKNQMHSDTSAIHVIKEAAWNWNEEGQYLERSSYRRGFMEFHWERRQAVEQGKTKIIVHSKESRHLEVVS